MFLVHLAFKSVRLKVVTGEDGLVGRIGVAQSIVESEGGHVMVAGERWQAIAQKSIPKGARVKIVRARNLVLIVEAYSGSGVSLAMSSPIEEKKPSL